MKRSLLLFLLCLLCNFSFYSLEISGSFSGIINPITSKEFPYSSSISEYRFEGSNYYLSMDVPDGSKAKSDIPEAFLSEEKNFYNEQGSFRLFSVYDDLYMIEFNSKSGNTYKKILGVLLIERRLFLYDGDDIFFEPTENYRWQGFEPEVIDFHTSSYLKENTILFDGSSFIRKKYSTLIPWVENHSGDGQNEWIELIIENGSEPFSKFIISNGYISFNKPYLYRANSRIKKIRILSPENEIDFIAEIQDTTNLQAIYLPKEIHQEISTFRFIIIDVYKGDKWNDTAINFIIPYNEDPFK